jgi:hypothetical protein
MICPHCNGRGTLYGEARTSRTTDTDTAQNAGKRHATDVRRFSSRSRQAKLLEAISRKPMTAQEAALEVLGTHYSISSVEACRRRVSDLKQAGFVIDLGDRRKNSGSPDESIVWHATLMGVFALEELRDTGWSA